VEIVEISGNFVATGIEGVVGILGRREHLNLAKEASLLDSVGSPCTGVEIAGLGAEEVHRSHAELEACTATEIEHVVPFGNIEELLDKSLSLVHYSHKFLGAMRNLKERKPGFSKIVYCIGRVLDGVLAKY